MGTDLLKIHSLRPVDRGVVTESAEALARRLFAALILLSADAWAFMENRSVPFSSVKEMGTDPLKAHSLRPVDQGVVTGSAEDLARRPVHWKMNLPPFSFELPLQHAG
jgi:hypothetical protein